MGVVHVGGRIGAAQGPEAFRKLFRRFQGPAQLGACVHDVGNVPLLTGDVATNHQKAISFIANLQPQYDKSVIIGGSHDHGYSQLAGIFASYSKAFSKDTNTPKLRLGCINIDAHLDVRKASPQITSGSPFYLALEAKILDPKRFIEFGIQTHCNALELWEYIQAKGVKVLPFRQLKSGSIAATFQKELKALSSQCDVIVVSFDIDSVAAAFAPGVSAPQAEGFTPMEIMEIMEISGSEEKIKSLGIFELNPLHDRDDQTARIAALAAYRFLEMAIQG